MWYSLQCIFVQSQQNEKPPSNTTKINKVYNTTKIDIEKKAN